LRVRRKDIFLDSYHQFEKLKTEDLRGKLHIEFAKEEAVDAGGVTREWFLVLSRAMFNADYALFVPSLNGQMF
jgi:E3 ubiquitin-protein ligase HUWE1